MKKENKIYILSYVLIVILLLLGSRTENYFKSEALINFAMNYFYYGIVFHYILFIVIGSLVGLSIFLKEKEKDGKWKIEGIKLAVTSVLPTFYIMNLIAVILAYSYQISLPFNFYRLLGNAYLIGEMGAESVIMMIWGFVIITSIKKYKVDEPLEKAEL